MSRTLALAIRNVMYKFHHPRTEDLVLTRILNALAHPTRLSIVKRLADEGELTCGELGVDRPKSSMSHHFRILHEAGLIRTDIQSSAHINSLRREDLENRFPGLLDAVLTELRTAA